MGGIWAALWQHSPPLQYLSSWFIPCPACSTRLIRLPGYVFWQHNTFNFWIGHSSHIEHIEVLSDQLLWSWHFPFRASSKTKNKTEQCSNSAHKRTAGRSSLPPCCPLKTTIQTTFILSSSPHCSDMLPLAASCSTSSFRATSTIPAWSPAPETMPQVH